MMQFFLLQNTLLVIFIIVGFWCSKRKNVYPIIVIAILLYTIIEGLRFGRGIDYNLYYDVYDQIEYLCVGYLYFWEYHIKVLFFYAVLF